MMEDGERMKETSSIIEIHSGFITISFILKKYLVRTSYIFLKI